MSLRDVALIDAGEQHRILQDWSRGAPAPHDRPRTIPELLEPSRAWDADRIAVRCGDERIDYPALHRRSDNLAALLAKNGAGRARWSGCRPAAASTWSWRWWPS
ncbi:linear gramicidin synthetase subunit D domain protein [Mycobacterium intracellulare 1956]|uniref:Linear gramicidin synthetase subunit D domain protein n=1 Tax=Mycobacterium intracellulare 1956 TaxID=1299331 RepID=X8CS03_MYCIT|nr:linear gramicidin synthetase subunit D domain protein [Mycobacterium intracellulare 1956]